MPQPQPTLTAVLTGTDGFTATVSGGSNTAVFSLYFRRAGSTADELVGTRTGNGAFPAVTGLISLAHYELWVVGFENDGYSLPGRTSIVIGTEDTLTAAIHTHFNSSPALVSSVLGGLWTGEVPEGSPFPYIWLDMNGINSWPTFVDQAEYARIQFHIYGLGAASAENVAKLVKGHFDYGTLEFSADSGIQCIAVAPQSYRLMCENLRHKTGQLVWRSVLTYQILLQRPR